MESHVKNILNNLDKIYAKFEDSIAQFKRILQSRNTQEALEYAQKLDEERRAIREHPVLRIAFVGQYSSGKSTIISALTGNQSIQIGADITTDKATPYSWNGIEIVDTPGIGTARQDHDEVTYAAIEKADLLVFCTTHMLLDSHIIEHFRKLAYEKGYSHKMMLIFNKLAAEAGDDNQKISNYRASMMQGLHPHSLDEFITCFFDARLYLKAVARGNKKIIDKSRFLTFVDELNKFVKDREKLAQIDTPIRRVLTYTEEIEHWFLHSEQDTLFLEGLQRISRRIRDEHKRLDIEVSRIALDAHSRICSLGSDFANEIPNFKEQSDLDTRQQEIGIELKELYQEVETKFNQAIENSFRSLQDDIKKILNSDFMVYFTASVETDGTTPGSSTPPGFDNHKFWEQVKKIGGFAKRFGLKPEVVAGQAARSFAKVPGGGYFLRSIDVAGSPLHKTVLGVGKAVGFKFKPFGAVGIAKNLGNAAKVAGPVLGILGVGLEVWDIQKQEKQAKKMRKVQGTIRDEFVNIARAVEEQLKEQLKEFLTQNYDYIEMQIRSEQEKYNKQQMSNSEQAAQLRKVQGQLKEFIQSLRY